MFHVGQLVQHIAGGHVGGFGDEFIPVVNTIYTVRDILADEYGRPCIRLAEIINTPRNYMAGFAEAVFEAKFFRPVDENRIAIFREALAPAPRKRVRA